MLDGTGPGSSQSWGTLSKFMLVTGVLPEPPTYKNSCMSRGMLPPFLIPLHPCPPPPRLLQVSNHLHTVIIWSFDNPPNVFELQHFHQRSLIDLKCFFCATPHLFLPLLLLNPLLSPGAHRCGLVTSVGRPPCDENITLGTARLGWIPTSRITTVSHTWHCMKCTQSALRLVTLSRHPPTRKSVSHASCRNDTR